MKKDYYEILGVPNTATPEELKKSYRQKARQHHPDVNKSVGAEEKFKEINEAYQVLSDPQKKAAYDQYGHSAFEPGVGPGPGGFGQGQQGGYQTYTWSSGGGDAGFGGFADPFDIFESIFGSSSPFGRQARLPRYAINISFMDAVHGTQKEIEVEGKRQTIKIPAGVDDGSEIKFANFIIVTQVGRDPRLNRRGYDIITEEEISFSQAALGTEKTVETIDGPVKIRIPAGTQPGTQIRLKSRGVKRVSGHGQGDHYIIVRVKIPNKLSREQKRLLEDLEEIS